MRTRHNDVVAEYLSEVDQRLAGLPVLQRRELLADLRAHVESERSERNLGSEGELIEVLERLGSPEVVAAAAHEEAEAHRISPPLVGGFPPAPRQRRGWPLVAAVGAALVVLFCLFGMFFAVRGGESAPMPEQAPAYPAPAEEVRPVPGR